MAEQRFNREKFIELVLYIAQSTTDDANFGAIKMAKALWRADFDAFAEYGTSITGAKYQRLENGPAAREFMPIIEDLERDGIAARVPQKLGDFDSTRVVHRRYANVGAFSPGELAIIHSAINYVRVRTATRVSDESHKIGWDLAEFREEIPYEAVLLPDEIPPVSEKTRKLAAQLAASFVS